MIRIASGPSMAAFPTPGSSSSTCRARSRPARVSCAQARLTRISWPSVRSVRPTTILESEASRPHEDLGSRLRLRELVDAGAAQSRFARGLQADRLAAEMAGNPWPQGVGNLLLARVPGATAPVLRSFPERPATGIADLPRVRFEVRERFYEWRTRFADDFPIPGTAYRPLWLDPRGGALSAEPVSSAGSVRYSARQTGAEPDRAEFAFTFRERTELVGNMKLKLWVAADGADDMDLEVGIKKFDRQGREVFFPQLNHMENGMVASGWLRVSHRELDEQRATPQQPWTSTSASSSCAQARSFRWRSRSAVRNRVRCRRAAPARHPGRRDPEIGLPQSSR